MITRRAVEDVRDVSDRALRVRVIFTCVLDEKRCRKIWLMKPGSLTWTIGPSERLQDVLFAIDVMEATETTYSSLINPEG